jgi:hypothetical protein
MKGDKIKYKAGYKYQLEENYGILTPIILPMPVMNSFIKLDMGGFLTIKAGYAWDGPSGPTYDSPSFMRGSLVHDALYQLLRADLIGQRYRETADAMLRDLCIEDGMWKWRAQYVYRAVRDFAMKAANAENEKKIITAP